jgi:hypothetical protein
MHNTFRGLIAGLAIIVGLLFVIAAGADILQNQAQRTNQSFEP